MKIKCLLTNSTEYRQLNCCENGIYTLKISKNYTYWYYDICDLIDFYKNTGIKAPNRFSSLMISNHPYEYQPLTFPCSLNKMTS